MSIINDIKLPQDIKLLKKKQLSELSSDVRQIITETSKSKDLHFSSNLGIVELTISLLRNFDPIKDTILFDTGHQTYPYKILTDRKNKFNTIKEENGISGLMNMNESPYDKYSPGHSGNIISVASGLYQANSESNKDAKGFYKNNKHIISVIGDGASANGLAFEALNDISYYKEPLIIIVNDNDMSISKPVGSMSKILAKARRTTLCKIAEGFFRNILKESAYNKFYNFVNRIQWMFGGKNIFEHFGIEYIGPVDGHNIKKLDNAMKRAIWLAKQGPVIIHVKTKKGKGNVAAEHDTSGDYHSLVRDGIKTYGMHATDKLIKLMNKDKMIRVINPAMTRSSNCDLIANKFPKRFYDVGIAEEHAFSKSSGMALAGLKPYVYIYSTFLQRSYDQLLHDISRLKLPCNLLIDRADIAPSEGSSHHGIYDVAFLKTLHNPIITSPRNIEQLNQLIDFTTKNKDRIFAIRYPKSDFIKFDLNENHQIKFGEWEYLKESNAKTCIISFGPIINMIYSSFVNKYNVDVINAIFITSYNENEIKKVFNKYDNIIIYERLYEDHGLASDFYKYKSIHNLSNKIIAMNFDKHIEHGTSKSLDKKHKMDMNSLDEVIMKVIGK